MWPELIGILNLTPDSFSDGGNIAGPQAAAAAALAMAQAGAAVIDIGAESTRPGATPLSAEEEWQRLSAPLEAVRTALGGKAAISVDTRHAATATRALALGADWINDVSGLQDPAMLAVLAQSGCRVVAMHSLSIPADPRICLPEDADPVASVLEFAAGLRTRLREHGIASERVIFDPGIGFGKSATQSLALLRRVDELAQSGLAVMIGHSRKSFLTQFTNAPASSRDSATLAVSLALAGRKVDFLRVHDVAMHRAAFDIFRAVAS